MKISAIIFKQYGYNMYIGVIKAKELAKALIEGKIKVDVWKPENPTGYQRTHSKTRSREYARFIAAGNISPTSILLSIRNDDINKIKYESGALYIPDDVTVYLCDGQHRSWGFVYCMNDLNALPDDFEIPVVIMLVKDAYEEAKQFVIINKTQKGVRTDLAEKFLQQAAMREGVTKIMEKVSSGSLPKAIFKDIEWRPKAVEIADILNDDIESVWYRRIKPPNVSLPTATIRQKSFTDSLKPILTHPDFKDLDASIIVKILNNYWNAIKELMPEAFRSPKEYIVQKTTGAFVFHRFFLTVAKYCKDATSGKYILRYGRIYDILSKLKDSEYLKPEAWRSSRRGIPGGKIALMGTSQKTFRTLSEILARELENRVKSLEIARARVEV